MSTLATQENKVRFADRVESVTRWFSGRQFPLAALSLLGSVVLLVAALISIPESAGTLGSFAADFRKWCFGQENSDETQWVRVILFFIDPIILGGIFFMIWRAPLRAARTREVVVYASTSLILVLSVAGFFAWQSQKVSAFAFPADRLRTSQSAPVFKLVDHNSRAASLADHQGNVVLITAFYSTCRNTCPMILGQVKRVVSSVPTAARRDLTVMAITLDPEHDSVRKLAATATAQGLDSTYRLVTGENASVHELLKALGIGSKKNPTSGVIEHANIMLLVDRNGKIAYRFTLGETQEKWLGEGVMLLLNEKSNSQRKL